MFLAVCISTMAELLQQATVQTVKTNPAMHCSTRSRARHVCTVAIHQHTMTLLESHWPVRTLFCQQWSAGIIRTSVHG